MRYVFQAFCGCGRCEGEYRLVCIGIVDLNVHVLGLAAGIVMSKTQQVDDDGSQRQREVVSLRGQEVEGPGRETRTARVKLEDVRRWLGGRTVPTKPKQLRTWTLQRVVLI